MLFEIIVAWLVSSSLWLSATLGLLLARARRNTELIWAAVFLAPACLVFAGGAEAYFGFLVVSLTVAFLYWLVESWFRAKDDLSRVRSNDWMRFSIRRLLVLTASIGWLLFVIARNERLELIASTRYLDNWGLERRRRGI